MTLLDEKIVAELRAGKTVQLSRRGGLMSISFDADTYVEVMKAVGNLKLKDWEMITDDSSKC